MSSTVGPSSAPGGKCPCVSDVTLIDCSSTPWIGRPPTPAGAQAEAGPTSSALPSHFQLPVLVFTATGLHLRCFSNTPERAAHENAIRVVGLSR
jgi:hypothetical protein